MATNEVTTDTLLAVEELTKAYPGTLALEAVDIRLRAGEIHAVIGENGAGKTTLLLLLSGVVPPNGGRILMDYEEVHFANPRDAQDAGIGIVFQELSLANNLTVAENIYANRIPSNALGLINRRLMVAETEAILAQLGSDIRADEHLGALSVGDRQLVEIAKALSLDAKVLLMDEPTSALSHEEADVLFGVLHRLARDGIGIIFVSHRLAEVFQIADRITILRDGRLVGTHPKVDITPEFAAASMVGRTVSDLYPDRADEVGTARLEVRGLRTTRIGPVDLAVSAGEIFGLAGLRGAGRTRIVRAVCGVERAEAGEIHLDGRQAEITRPWHAARHGIGYVPANRKDEGIFAGMTVAENLSSAALERVSRGGIIRRHDVHDFARSLIDEFGIRAASVDQPMSELSGGNQQKCLLARWLVLRPRVLVVDEPTQGIDVGSKADIHRLLREIAAAGTAVLVVSSEMPEVLGLCDRIAVVAKGRIRGVLQGADATEEDIIALAAEEREFGTGRDRSAARSRAKPMRR